MTKKLKPDTWIWVVVQNPGANEQFLGQHDEKTNTSFIPAFYQKEDAVQCLFQFTIDKKQKYEVQAIFFGELAKDAAQNEFMIFMLDENGKISEKINPKSEMTAL
jgi:hypothetical protein